MASSTVKLIKRPPKANLQFRGIQQEIAKQLQPLGRQHVQERDKATSGFEHDIKFAYEVKVSGAQVTLAVLVTNSGEKVSDNFTTGQLWTALDRTGIRPHVIRARNRPVLSFVANYQPHTRPIARSGGPGRATGNRVFRKVVNHPGYPPRKFSETINKRLRRQFEQAIDRGVRLGSRKSR